MHVASDYPHSGCILAQFSCKEFPDCGYLNTCGESALRTNGLQTTWHQLGEPQQNIKGHHLYRMCACEDAIRNMSPLNQRKGREHNIYLPPAQPIKAQPSWAKVWFGSCAVSKSIASKNLSTASSEETLPDCLCKISIWVPETRWIVSTYSSTVVHGEIRFLARLLSPHWLSLCVQKEVPHGCPHGRINAVPCEFPHCFPHSMDSEQIARSFHFWIIYFPVDRRTSVLALLQNLEVNKPTHNPCVGICWMDVWMPLCFT